MAQRSSSPGPLVHIRSLFSPEAEPYSEDIVPVVQPATDTGPTFHPFPRLPTELRLQIWEWTVEPRTVELHCNHSTPSPDRDGRKVYSSTPAPATLHACLESRKHLWTMYPQVPIKNAGWKCLNPPMRGKRGWRKNTPKWRVTDETTQEYVFLNWEIDTVSTGTYQFKCFESIKPLIRILQFERDNGDEFWQRDLHDSGELRDFKNVNEIHVMCPPGHLVESWYGCSEEYPWPCSPENIWITDQNQTIRCTDLEEMCDREQERRARELDPASTVRFRNGESYDEQEWNDFLRTGIHKGIHF